MKPARATISRASSKLTHGQRYYLLSFSPFSFLYRSFLPPFSLSFLLLSIFSSSLYLFFFSLSFLLSYSLFRFRLRLLLSALALPRKSMVFGGRPLLPLLLVLFTLMVSFIYLFFYFFIFFLFVLRTFVFLFKY
jgi:hypothetical protein